MKFKILIILSLLSFSNILFSQNQDNTTYDIVVAQDGSGDFSTIQEAIYSIRAFMTDTKKIFVKKGIYKEKVIIPSWCLNVLIVGEDKENTILTWNDHANMPIPGTTKKMGTFRTYTLLIQGHNIEIQNLTIENNAPQLGQAVALHIEGENVKLLNCKCLGNQDTVYGGNHLGHHWFENCYIEGTVDFIFGPSRMIFKHCTIHSKKNSYITAPATPQGQDYGFIFYQCKLTANPEIQKVYLGRPWRPYGHSCWIECEMGKHILPVGWDNWRNPENEKTARFEEYASTGEGGDMSHRRNWSKKLTKKEVKKLHRHIFPER